MHTQVLQLLSLVTLLGGQSLTAKDPDGHFSSWEDVPQLIESISPDSYDQPLGKLRQLTRITLGSPQRSGTKKEQDAHVLQTKKAWQQWWLTTGKPTAALKKQNAKVDPETFSIAWDFLGTELPKPKSITPVWIPEIWTLSLSYSNGDYGGREKEVWIIQRLEKSAKLFKLRGDYGKEGWQVSLMQYRDLSQLQADQTLKALCYLHKYAPSHAQDVQENEMKTYYAGATLSLRDEKNHLLWNINGYDFKKTRANIDLAEAGRSYYFLNSIYKTTDTAWRKLTQPSSVELAAYRQILSQKKPYFFSNASEIILLFGKYGHAAELESILQWADKQKLAINPKMHWSVHRDEFGQTSKTNVINFTRSAFQDTLTATQKIQSRVDVNDAAHAKIKILQQDLTDMLSLKKKEEADDINRHPQPLRDLIKVNRHPNDPDLEHLKAAIQKIRKKPNPKLFTQLVAELDDGTLEMISLLRDILLNKNDVLDITPWQHRQEFIAIHACIDALPAAEKIGELDDLVTVILKVCGGGKIEIAGKNGGSMIELKRTEGGYSTTYSNAENPLSLQAAQKELSRIYTASRKR